MAKSKEENKTTMFSKYDLLLISEVVKATTWGPLIDIKQSIEELKKKKKKKKKKIKGVKK